MPPQTLLPSSRSQVLHVAQRAAVAYLVDRARRLLLAALPPREVAEDGQGGGQGGVQAAGCCRRRSAWPSAAARCELAAPRMMDAVPTADVVVTNPTHYAVALSYDARRPGADRRRQGRRPPRAARSAQPPSEHGVAVVPDPPLARALYASVEVGQMIPEELFHAVAQLLAYVYRVAGARRSPEPPHERAAEARRPPRRPRRRGRRRAGRGDDGHPAAARCCSTSSITLNISAALMIVVATLYVPRALDFSSFPSLLLLTTLFRLAINVSVTRLILLHGDAGHVVDGVRQLRRRRQRGRRPRDLPDPDRDPVRRDHQRRRPRRRGGRALHPRRHAGQADGDRRRPERRPDHRRGGAQAAAPRSPARPTSTARWTAPRSSSRATRWPAS